MCTKFKDVAAEIHRHQDEMSHEQLVTHICRMFGVQLDIERLKLHNNLVEDCFEREVSRHSALQAAYDKANRLRMEAEDVIRHQEGEIELLKATLTALGNGWRWECMDYDGVDENTTIMVLPPLSDKRSTWAARWITVVGRWRVPHWIVRECDRDCVDPNMEPDWRSA